MIYLKFLIILNIFGQIYGQRNTFLRRQGSDLYYGNDKVFLSGVNLPFYKDKFGWDFGNQNYENESRQGLEAMIRNVSAAGGNFVRVWVHCEGMSTPEWRSDGTVSGTDRDRNLISDLGKFLDYAAQYDVFVMLNLWTGGLETENIYDLIQDDNKIRSYINNALSPMVRGLRNKPALAIWELMNEPEAYYTLEENQNQCRNTKWYGNWGMGYTGKNIFITRFQKFINWQAAAIHRADRKALVSLGSLNEHFSNDAFDNCFNFLKDECLIDGGGQRNGIIDVYQIHTYAHQGKYFPDAPFNVKGTDYKLNRPVIIGEFSTRIKRDNQDGKEYSLSEGRELVDLFNYAYNNNYNGAASWSYKQIQGESTESTENQDKSMRSIANFKHNGVIKVRISK